MVLLERHERVRGGLELRPPEDGGSQKPGSLGLPPPRLAWPPVPSAVRPLAPSTVRPLARGPRVLIGLPLPLGFGLDGRLLLARRGRVYV